MHSLAVSHAEAYICANEHQMAFRRTVKKGCHERISTPSYQKFIGYRLYRYI